MGDTFISKLTIENVRHLKDITIPLSEKVPKHLILTGKNGSGKTSVLEEISRYLYAVTASDRYVEGQLEPAKLDPKTLQLLGVPALLGDWPKLVSCGVSLQFTSSLTNLQNDFQAGRFILAYYKAERLFQAEIPKHVGKIELKETYSIDETPRENFVKYMIDLKVTEALARTGGKLEKAEAIRLWFKKFQELLRKIFEDDTLELIFDEDNFTFLIKEKNRNLFDFNTLSSGFAAVLDIVLDIIIRMEKNTNRSFLFNIPGIVLIDEIETHLHLDLQKTVLSLLTTIFPNIQFIVSTHSPFILNSLEDVVIYDLEKKILVEHGLADVPYGGIVEGYFNVDVLSALMKEKFERYKVLVKKENLSDDDFEEIARLEMFLNETPDYLALEFSTEYQRLKMDFESREDI